MKFKLLLIMMVSSLGLLAQETPNWDVSTMRIGPFRIQMKAEEAMTLAKKPLVMPKESNNYSGVTTVKYADELIIVTLNSEYGGEDETKANAAIAELSTKSSKFKTKSGIGIGSTREDLWNTYKDFSRIEIFKPYDDNGGRIESDRNFTIYDDEAGAMLIFILRNNKVVEIKVSLAYEGC